MRSPRNIIAPVMVVLLSGCITPTPPDPEACEAGVPVEEFSLGKFATGVGEEVQIFADGCRDLEVISGPQGGWHVEPAIQAPAGSDRNELGGQTDWTIEAGGEVVTQTAEFKLWNQFWSDVDGGLAYWGDQVAFHDYPEDHVGTEVNLRVDVEFDDSRFEDRTLETVVRLVDEIEESGGGLR